MSLKTKLKKTLGTVAKVALPTMLALSTGCLSGTRYGWDRNRSRDVVANADATSQSLQAPSNDTSLNVSADGFYNAISADGVTRPYKDSSPEVISQFAVNLPQNDPLRPAFLQFAQNYIDIADTYHRGILASADYPTLTNQTFANIHTNDSQLVSRIVQAGLQAENTPFSPDAAAANKLAKNLMTYTKQASADAKAHAVNGHPVYQSGISHDSIEITVAAVAALEVRYGSPEVSARARVALEKIDAKLHHAQPEIGH